MNLKLLKIYYEFLRSIKFIKSRASGKLNLIFNKIKLRNVNGTSIATSPKAVYSIKVEKLRNGVAKSANIMTKVVLTQIITLYSCILAHIKIAHSFVISENVKLLAFISNSYETSIKFCNTAIAKLNLKAKLKHIQATITSTLTTIVSCYSGIGAFLKQPTSSIKLDFTPSMANISKFTLKKQVGLAKLNITNVIKLFSGVKGPLSNNIIFGFTATARMTAWVPPREVEESSAAIGAVNNLELTSMHVSKNGTTLNIH